MTAKNGPLFYLIAISSFLLLSFASGDADNGYKPVSDLPAFKARFSEASKNISSLSGTFTQQKSISALTETITSKGKLWFKKDNKVRLDYATPFSYQVIINGDKMLVKDAEKKTEMNAGSNKLFQQMNGIIVDCMRGTILDSKDFDVKAFEDEGSYLIELTPVSKSLKQFLSTIVLIVDRKNNTPTSIQLNEPSGDKTEISVSNKVINGFIADEVFAF